MTPPTAPAAAPPLWDPRQVSARRSLSLMALGALIGLALAGYALFTARGTTTFHVPAEDVALVNQQPIARADFYAQLQATFGVDSAHTTPAQRRRVLNDMIREELFVQRGKELDIAATDPDVRTAMVSAVEQMAAADAVTSQPSDSALQAYFNAHQDRYAQEGVMSVRDLVFAQPADAAGAARALAAGAPITATLGRFRGRDSGREAAEDFYFAAKIHLGAALFAVARALPSGAVSPPFAQPDGVHLLYMARNAPPQPFAFAEARAQVLSDYRNDKVKRTTAQYQGFLRQRANVLVAGDLR
ncbi:MAG TPA: peptidyl-prolyl cis-trans isomerase [Phenylobacterium sp.]|jgi:parvulin-like peptidyl-prolyl isomerase|uniref:peptidyl-prolyl cis-trans isomerase n=1 Tax=Phenylobacterium sp. TaxID=1871053 RepID=UPI002CF95341|nr:peptidyl-prolyl cis-trans isomerase [Phenylobacterium sp.]HXA40555.1 peptidyl-prolyl cis-trans isomerase [Phenylobacterium sp.]